MILAFDLATRTTGYCAGTGEVRPEAGNLKFDQTGDSLGQLGIAFWSAAGALFDRFKPTLVVYEAPILVIKGKMGAGRTDRLPVVRKLYGMGFLLETMCELRGVPIAEVGLHAIKREVTGQSHADKDAMVAVARRCGLTLPDGVGARDAADAWGAWLIGLRHNNKEASARWDRLIWSRRGALL